MITPKAQNKLYSFSFLSRLNKGNMEAMALMVAAHNVLITDITNKGELILKHLNEKTQKYE